MLGSKDPRSPDYDPYMVVRAMLASPDTLFDAEPRVDAFATHREAALRARFEDVLREHAPSLPLTTRIECRTSTCRVDIDAARRLSGAETNQFFVPLSRRPIADSAQVGPEQTEAGSRIRYTLVFSREHRDHAAYEAWLRR